MAEDHKTQDSNDTNDIASILVDNNTSSVALPGLLVDNGIDPNTLAIQQMHDLEPLGWNGGDNFFDGLHDDFCFVCASPKELFACQTCENCYHANCMTPSLDPNEVPAFWFCPHCVVNEFHIPPSATDDFSAPLPTTLSTLLSTNGTSSRTAELMEKSLITGNDATSLAYTKEISRECPRRNGDDTFQTCLTQQPTPPISESPHLLKTRSRPQGEDSNTNPRKVGRPRRMSPARKKSKYSVFPKEVEKALAVIHAELEIAAGYGKAEGNLENKIQTLEQQMKMQEGQMLLTTRELEFARNELAQEREASAGMKTENLGFRQEIARLKDDIQRKDAELKDWRMKLRSMIGSDFE